MASVHQLSEFEKLSLVNKISLELENHLGIADKTLAEFLIALYDQTATGEIAEYQRKLEENEADFPPPLVHTLHRVITQMKKPFALGGDGAADQLKYASDFIPVAAPNKELDVKAMQFPGLAKPNESVRPVDKDIAESLLQDLESIGKKKDTEKERSPQRRLDRSRSRDRSRRRSSRSRSRERTSSARQYDDRGRDSRSGGDRDNSRNGGDRDSRNGGGRDNRESRDRYRRSSRSRSRERYFSRRSSRSRERPSRDFGR